MKSSFYVVVFCALALFLSLPVQASQTLTNALRQVEQGHVSNALSARASLSGAAKDTLSWAVYKKGSPSTSFSEVAGFIMAHSDWPHLITIQEKAEKNITATDMDAKVISFFNKRPPVTAKAMNLYLRALVQQGNMSKAKQVLNNWWEEASLSREGQQQIFGSYGSYITKKSHLERLRYLLDKKSYSNASAIASVLGSGYPALERARQGLQQGKGNVNSLINAVSSNLQNDEGFLLDRLIWRRKNKLNQGAIEILNSAPPASKMYDASKWWKERHILVRRLMEGKQYKTAYRLASSHKQKEGFPKIQAEWVSGFLALRFVNQPYKAFEHFEALYKQSKTPLSKSRGAYWLGRASEALNQPQIASQWYNVASRYPETFYGQMAGEKIGKVVALNMKGSAGGQGVSNNDLARAASYLSQAGFRKDSSAFLLQIKDKATSAAEYERAANLAKKLGQPHIAIKIAQALQKEKGISLGQFLYPQKVRELQNVRNVEWAFVNAIIRQESRFDYTAVSHAGARGLMQLMPATAKQTASKKGVRHQKAWLTSRPAHNISLGSSYLSQMVGRYKGNYAMAAAAYNAGPGRVDRWIKQLGDPRHSQVDLVDWVEQVPIYETRNYVQRVLEGVYVYRSILKGQQPPVSSPIHVATN